VGISGTASLTNPLKPTSRKRRAFSFSDVAMLDSATCVMAVFGRANGGTMLVGTWRRRTKVRDAERGGSR